MDAYNGIAPFVANSDTSRAAALNVTYGTETLRDRIYGLLYTRLGGTCDEVEAWTGLSHQTVSARIRELVLQGRLIDTGLRKATRSGRKARVYGAVE